jgi:hypothetical protein
MTHEQNTPKRSNPEATRRTEALEHGEKPRTGAKRFLVSVAIVGALVAVAIPIGLLISSCGSGSDGKEEHAAAQPPESTPASDAVARAPLSGALPASMTSDPKAADDSVPVEAQSPDLAVTVADTVVVPGDRVQVLVESSPDVTEMSLWDGMQDRQALTYDASTKFWMGTYRVPLKPTWQRVGLSVTAKNEAGRWHRVWVFLNVKPEGSEVATQADSSR